MIRGIGRKNLNILTLLFYGYFLIISLIILALLLFQNGHPQNTAYSVQPSSLGRQHQASIFNDAIIRSTSPSPLNQTKWAPFKMRFRNLELEYEMSVPVDGFCAGKSILVIVVTRADIEGYLFRRAIRRSWLKKERIPNSVAYRFIVGEPPKDESNQMARELLRWEQAQYNDLLFATLPDVYENLFMKTHALLQWKVAYCPEAKVLLKIDDDTVFSLERLDYWYRREIVGKMREFPIMALCNVLKDKVPYRDEWFRWHVPMTEFADSVFPEYCNGAIYMLTDQAVIHLLTFAPMVDKMRLEDVLFTGVLGQLSNLTRFDTPAFSYDIVTHECSDEGIPLQMGVFGFGYSFIEWKFNELNTVINCTGRG